MRPSELSKGQTNNLGSAVSRSGGSLATIKEREEVRSADPNVSKSRKMAAAVVGAQMAVKN